MERSEIPRSCLGLYILDDDNTPIRASTEITWSRFMFDNPERRIVARDEIGPFRISTVFLGIDHAFLGGPPLLFETMVFGGSAFFQDNQTRCSTWSEAETMHAQWKAVVAVYLANHPQPMVGNGFT